MGAWRGREKAWVMLLLIGFRLDFLAPSHFSNYLGRFSSVSSHHSSSRSVE